MVNLYYAKLFKSGDGLVFNIPVDIARGLQLGRGDIVAVAVGDADTVFFRRISDAEKLAIKPDTIKI